MDSRIDDAPRRSLRYWYDDGLAELLVGALFLLLAALFAIEGRAPAGSLPAAFSAFGLPVLVIGGTIAGGLAVRAIKERLTYPRTGYVSYPRARPARKGLAGILGGVISLVLVLILAARPGWIAALPAVQGASVALILGILALRSGLSRLAIQGSLALAGGLAASFIGAEIWTGSALVFGVTGLASLGGGAYTLMRYLRATNPPAESA